MVEWGKQDVVDDQVAWGQQDALASLDLQPQIDASIKEMSQSYGGLFDVPATYQPEKDIGQAIEQYSKTGIDRPDLIEIAGALNPSDPEFDTKFKVQVQRRQYRNALDELQWGTAGGLLQVGSAGQGTVAAAERFFARSPVLWPLTRFGPLREAGRMADVDSRAWETRANELHTWAKQYEVQPGEGGGFLGFAMNATGQALPMMTASVASSLVFGPTGAWAVAASIEGDNWYRDALANGASSEEAGIGRVVVGTINGVVELAQVGQVLRVGKAAQEGALPAFKAAIRERALKKLAASTGRLTANSVKQAIEEGTEEVIQTWVGEGAAVVVYGKDVDLQEMAAQTGQSFAGGATAGAILGGGTLVLQGVQTQEGDEQVRTARPPMVMREDEYAAFEAEQQAAQETAGTVGVSTEEATDVQATQAAEGTAPAPGQGGTAAQPGVAAPAAVETAATVAEAPTAPVAEEVTPTVAESATGQKQPWEMTNSEAFHAVSSVSSREQLEQIRPLLSQLFGHKTADWKEPGNYDPWGIVRAIEKGDEIPRIPWAKNQHKVLVQQAVAEGKPVPLDVLEDYASEPWAQEAIAKMEKGVPHAVQGQETRPQGPVTNIGPTGQTSVQEGVEAATAKQAAPAPPDTKRSVPPGMDRNQFEQWLYSAAGFPLGTAESLDFGDQWKRYQEAYQAPKQPAPAPNAPEAGQQPSTQGEIVPPAAPGATQPPTEQGGQRLTSARQAMLNEDRRALGMDELDSPAKRKWQTALNEARAQHEKDPYAAQRLAAGVLANPVALNDTQTALLVIRANEIKNEHADLMSRIGQARDGVDIETLSAQIGRMETEFDSLTQALYRSGTEKGRALASQKLTINQDFSLVSVRNRAKAAKGAELSDAEAKRFETLTAQLQDKSAQVEALEKAISELKAQQEVAQARKSANRKRMSPEQKASERSRLTEKVKTLLEAGCR